MRAIDPAILQAAAGRDRLKPAAFVDIYADVQARIAINSTAQWVGIGDPMQTADTNVSFDRIVGAVTLAPGASVAAVYAGPDKAETTLYMNGHVQAHWHTVGNWVSGHRSVHDSFTKSISAQASEQGFSFTAAATQIVDSIIIRASYTGYTSRQCYVRIIDHNATQVGNAAYFTPGTSVTSLPVSGLAASLVKGRRYTLLIGFQPFTSGELPNPYFVANTNYSYSLSVYSYAVASSAWRIDGTAGAWSTGGSEGFVASGSLTRQMDMGALPTGSGTLSVTDIVPPGTTLTLTAYYTDSATIAAETTLTNWTLFGVVDSGATLPAHQYWRITADMTANAANDDAPVLSTIEITYQAAPVSIGTHASRGEVVTTGFTVPWVMPLTVAPPQVVTYIAGARALANISTASAQMAPRLANSMIGQIRATMTPEPIVNDMASKPLRGKQAVVRFGYVINGKPVVSDVYTGIVADMTWDGKTYNLIIQDDLDIVDVKVPRQKAGPAWSSATDYAVGDKVVYGTNSWNALTASGPGAGGAVTPGADPAVWQDNGTVWTDIVYTSLTSPDAGLDWHLADVCKDLLLNRVNIPTHRVDLQSLADLKTAYPNMRGSRTLTKPVGVIEMLTELAWLLNAQWIMRQGKIALVEEPTGAPVETITDNDIGATFNYRRGWKDLKNECLILSGYTGDGNQDSNFLDSQAYADAASVEQYNMVGLEVFRDKWNVAAAELVNRSTIYVNRWKDGRRVITNLSANMRLMAIEPSDVVSFASIGMPPYDRGLLDYVVDWLRQTLKFTLMEK
jgi:hypothetical protein